MNVIGIKELQTNPGKLSHSLLNNEYMLITRRGEPLGVPCHSVHRCWKTA